MKIGTITISAAIIGAIWGAIWMIVIGILLMLVSGITASPPAGTALVAGLAFIILPIEKRTRTAFAILGVGIAVLLFLLTGGQVFGTTISEGILYQILAWAIWSALVVISIKMCLQDYQTGSAKRYRMELLLIRVLKGLAFVLFTIVVILPFYVMVMTSLKSQQS